ncbi:hypothetical protein QAD02_021547 [Eretmocerus hayati]|uniref:Uncharacterized protein n=1 Tax=Eretmocerus hayati TaxID=131215 RepID=A0ACC2PR23_9HYME|nr:hypothetical protein QAD02_021547 [Eretmocerus hayati]
MLYAGKGETDTNTLLSGMNIPPVHSTTLRRYERLVGSKMEELAQQSCREAIGKEKDLTRQKQENGCDNSQEKQVCVIANDRILIDIAGSFDAAWPKRGKTHNSMSGHASLIGAESGKVLGWACRKTYCRKCSEDNPNDDDNHEKVCRRNHLGSAKSGGQGC